MSRDNAWWMDGEEYGEEETGEYEEYFDVESRKWVRVSKKPTYEEDSEALGGQEPASIIHSSKPAYSNPVSIEEEPGGDVDDGWLIFDSGDLLRGRGEARKPSRPFQHTTGLKLYIAVSALMAGMLAISGRFIELGIVGASVLTVILVSRWRRWA